MSDSISAMADEVKGVEMLDQSIHDMVCNMREETELSASLQEAGKSIFRSQMSDAFKWHGGPMDYWSTLEEHWRCVTGGEPIPTKYRTNKSVILKAYKHDPIITGWYDPAGEVLGKSAIQNTFSGGSKLTSEGAMRQIIRIIDKVKHDSGPVARRSLMKDLHAHLKELL